MVSLLAGCKVYRYVFYNVLFDNMNVLVVAFGKAPRRWPAMNLLFEKILCAELRFEIYLKRQPRTVKLFMFMLVLFILGTALMGIYVHFTFCELSFKKRKN
jgi:hypothetical protein